MRIASRGGSKEVEESQLRGRNSTLAYRNGPYSKNQRLREEEKKRATLYVDPGWAREEEKGKKLTQRGLEARSTG